MPRSLIMSLPPPVENILSRAAVSVIWSLARADIQVVETFDAGNKPGAEVARRSSVRLITIACVTVANCAPSRSSPKPPSILVTVATAAQDVDATSAVRRPSICRGGIDLVVSEWALG